MSAIVLDVETTGLDEPDVISLATTPILLNPSEVSEATAIVSQFFKPRKPISYGAMATHHIIEDDVAAAAVWPGSWTPPTGVEYVCGHNVDYDYKAIGPPTSPASARSRSRVRSGRILIPTAWGPSSTS